MNNEENEVKQAPVRALILEWRRAVSKFQEDHPEGIASWAGKPPKYDIHHGLRDRIHRLMFHFDQSLDEWVPNGNITVEGELQAVLEDADRHYNSVFVSKPVDRQSYLHIAPDDIPFDEDGRLLPGYEPGTQRLSEVLKQLIGNWRWTVTAVEKGFPFGDHWSYYEDYLATRDGIQMILDQGGEPDSESAAILREMDERFGSLLESGATPSTMGNPSHYFWWSGWPSSAVFNHDIPDNPDFAYVYLNRSDESWLEESAQGAQSVVSG